MVHVGLQENKSVPSQTYIFHSLPKTLCKKAECMDKKPTPHDQIMFERRLAKRQDFGNHPTPTAEKDFMTGREAEARRRAIARRKAQRTMILNLQSKEDLPPVEGRKHDSVQTEIYFEELFDHPVEISVETQTDLKLDRPEYQLFVPCKNGVDVATYIKPGDLITFDMEVGPLIEVLIGKTLEQALVETMEEQEHEDIRRKQREYIEVRNAELAEELRLQERDIRIKEEMKRKMIDIEKGKQIQNETRERVAAAVMTRGFLNSIVSDVVHGLHESGRLYDPIQREIEARFMPWLMDRVREELRRILDADKLASNILGEILRMRDEESLKRKIEIQRSVLEIGDNFDDTGVDSRKSISSSKSFTISSFTMQSTKEDQTSNYSKSSVSYVPWSSVLQLM